MFTCKDLHSTRLSSGPPLAGDAPILASDDSQRLVGKASRNRICFSSWKILAIHSSVAMQHNFLGVFLHLKTLLCHRNGWSLLSALHMAYLTSQKYTTVVVIVLLIFTCTARTLDC